MWPQIITISTLVTFAVSETIPPGIEREFSDGVSSLGYKVVYGDADMTVINEVVHDAEKASVLKSKVNLYDAIPPLPAKDVKCLMSVDSYCSKEMRHMKGVLIQALKEDCVKCTTEDKAQAGKMVASMMAHDSVAWKLFLTRYDGLKRVQRILGSALNILPPRNNPKPTELRYKLVGEPEEIESSKSRYTMAGFKIRVKRYQAEKMP